MSYYEFEKTLAPFKIFSLTEIRKAFPRFDSKRLVEWQEKGYLKKLINKWYLFADVPITEYLLYRASNCLHHPSYLSLESALAYYHLIPEAVYTLQGVSTRKTTLYRTPVGAFNYRSINREFYFGYEILHLEGLPVLMAEKEKALLDYFYFNSRLKTLHDMESLRLNLVELQSQLDWEKFFRYAAVFASPTLDRRIKLFKKMMLHARTA